MLVDAALPSAHFVATILAVQIEFDPDKNAINIAKHGLPLASFAHLDMNAAVIKQDARHDYGETRYVAAAPLEVIG